ncbi:MAG: hypothetical protein ACRDJ2_16160 [Actinomycetota bacterium]
MRSEYVWAIVGFLIVGALAIWSLSLAANGSLPTAFGLFDMNNLGVRIVVIVVLAIITVGLFLAYNSVRKRTK